MYDPQSPFAIGQHPQIQPLSGQDFLPTQTMPMQPLSSAGDVQAFMQSYADYQKRKQMAQPQQPTTPQQPNQPGVNGPWQADEETDPKAKLMSMFSSLFNGSQS